MQMNYNDQYRYINFLLSNAILFSPGLTGKTINKHKLYNLYNADNNMPFMTFGQFNQSLKDHNFKTQTIRIGDKTTKTLLYNGGRKLEELSVLPYQDICNACHGTGVINIYPQELPTNA